MNPRLQTGWHGNVSKKHGAHLKAMNEMQVLMQKPDAMKEWYDNKKKELDELP